MRIEIQLEEINPLAGQVSADEQPPLAFSGWLGLLRILDQLISSAKLAPERRGDELDA